MYCTHDASLPKIRCYVIKSNACVCWFVTKRVYTELSNRQMMTKSSHTHAEATTTTKKKRLEFNRTMNHNRGCVCVCARHPHVTRFYTCCAKFYRAAQYNEHGQLTQHEKSESFSFSSSSHWIACEYCYFVSREKKKQNKNK